MNLRNIFMTDFGRYKAPTVERIDISVEEGFALTDDGYGPEGMPGDELEEDNIYDL